MRKLQHLLIRFRKLFKNRKFLFVYLPLFFLLLALPLVIVVSQRKQQTKEYAATSANLLQNGDFENTGSAWLSPWTLLTRNGAAATITQDGVNPACGNYSAHATVTATSPNPWDVELYQGNIPITQGQTLTLTFFAKASAPRTINAMLEQNYGSYNAYFNQAIQISTTWQQYTVTYTPTVSDSNTLFTFNLAQSTGDVWIDNAILAPVAVSAPTNTPVPAPTATPVPTSGPTPTGTTGMSAPPGYSNLIFDDQFSGTTLDSTKWISQMADAQYGIWQDNGKLPNPYSAVSNDGGYNAEYGDPSEVVINNGLTLNAQRDSTFSFYTWKAGYITTHGKFTFNHGFAQFRAKMPDSTTGGWAGFWFLDGGGEIDLDESGYTACGSGSIINQCIASNLHTSGNSQHMYNAGVDLSVGYHTYGMEYKPGQSITIYLDGKQITQFTSNVPTGAYTILVTETMAQNASGWHTLTGSSTPSPMSPFDVSEVQVWQ